MADDVAGSVRSLFAALQSKSPHRGAQAAQLASDLRTISTESVSDTDLSYGLSVLFHKDSGILCFLRKAVSLEEFSGCKEELLHLLEDVIGIQGNKILPYAVEIKEVCVSLFSREKASKVKNATFPPLSAVLKLCERTSQAKLLAVPKLVDKYFKACMQPTKHTATVRGAVFQLLGTLCEVYPEDLVPRANRLIEIYMTTLKSEMGSKTKKPEMAVIGGCLRGLCSLLRNFSHSAAEGSPHAQDIYKFTRMAIDTKAALTRYEVPRAGLAIVGKHAAQFGVYLVQDYEYMYKCLYEWCGHGNAENKQLAFQALDAFFRQISVAITEEGEEGKQKNTSIFRDFIKKFRAIIDSNSTSHRELAVAIKGYGYFAAPCRLFMKQADVQFMFVEMVQRSETLFFSPQDSSEDRLLHLPSFLGALACITHEIDEVSESLLVSLEKLMVYLFECFPRLPVIGHTATFHAVVRLLDGMSHSRATLKSFLAHVVYQGLIRTCSHPVVIHDGNGSAPVSVGSTDLLGQRQPSFQDYLPLWLNLMDPSCLRDSTFQFLDPAPRETLHQLVYDEVVSAVLRILRKLNLSSGAQEEATESAATPPGSVATPPGPADSPMPDPEAASALQATVPADVHVFINLVDLCRELFSKVLPSMFQHWVFPFGHEVIVMSSRLPLVSGFYKLLALCLRLSKKVDYFKGIAISQAEGDEVAMETDVNSRQACLALFWKFTREVLVRMQQYKDDLLASCLHLLLSLPIELVRCQDLLEGLGPMLQTTFTLGLSYLPLVSAGMNALEAWSQQLEPTELAPLIKSVLPCLDAFLKTSGSADPQGSAGTVVVPSRSKRGRRMPVKVLRQVKAGIESAESPQHKLRCRMVHFLGSLGGVVSAALSERGPAATEEDSAIAWDTKNHLVFAVPFQDMKPSLCLDPFLPRVCTLALSSSDRQTKIAACELLHALVLFLLGKSAQPALQKKSPMTRLFRRVFPVLLQLACDVEKVAEQLFRPLVAQVIHWLTGNTKYESQDTIALLEAILDGIVHPTDTALRDFSATCVKEFLTWSIKQTTRKQQEKSPANTKSLLKRLYSLGEHPSAAKRLGAALAFNSIYTVFREEEALVDMFVLEMLVENIGSLRLAHRDDKSLGTREQASQAVRHLARIVRVKAALFVGPSPQRRKPRGLKEASLATLVSWLLLQCGSPETDCRLQCRSLFLQFAPLLPKIPNARMWIRKTMESEGGAFFVTRFEKGGRGQGVIQKQPELVGPMFSVRAAVSWLEGLAAALDCYVWVLGDQLLAPSEVFQVSESQSCLFRSLHQFLTRLACKGVEAAVACFSAGPAPGPSPREVEEYGEARGAVVLCVLRLATALITSHPNEAISHVPGWFWGEPLFRLVLRSCLQPASTGFSPTASTSPAQLHRETGALLMAMPKLPGSMLEAFVSLVSSEVSLGSSRDLIGRLPLPLYDEEVDHAHLDDIIAGYLLLEKASLLMQALGRSPAAVAPLLLEAVTEALRPLVVGGEGHGSERRLLSPASERTATLLLELALEIGITPSLLVETLLDCGSDCPGLGLLLFQSFSAVLSSHLAHHHTLVLGELLGHTASKPATVSTVLSGLLEHVARDQPLRRRYGTTIASQLLSQWSRLGPWWAQTADSSLKLAAINVLRKMLALEPKLLLQSTPDVVEPVLSLYCALLEDSKNPLTFKSAVLEVAAHFASLPGEARSRLKSSLAMMIAQQFPLKSSEFPPGSPRFMEYISVIDKLLSAMVVSGSLALLELLLGVMCREVCHAHEDQFQASLSKLIANLSSSEATSAINVAYAMFTDEQGYPPEARKAAAERVCLPCLRASSVVTLREFFLEHVLDIMACVEAPLAKSSVESRLVSKLCCFQFLEVLYARLPSAALTAPDSSINSAYCRGAAKTGKELTQAATKAGHAAKSEDLHGDRTHYETRRQYHCRAYNMLLAIVSCTQTKHNFYTAFLFKEDTSKGQFLWDNLVDAEKKYHFEAELESPLNRKKLMTSIRDQIGTTSREGSPVASPPFSPRYLSSQYLAESSLSSDVSQYDFSAGAQAFPTINIGTSADIKESSYLVSEENLEQDDLNVHECMLPLMRLLDHMQLNKISPEVAKDSPPTDMPPWMACLHRKFSDAHTHTNIRLFIARLISNRAKLFQPYARFWLASLIQLVVGGDHGGVGLHYFVVDVVVTVLSWAPSAIPEESYLASRLLAYLMQYCHYDNRSVFRNNLDIIKTLVECWREKLQVPTKVIYQNFSNPNPDAKSNRTGVQLLGVILANRLPAYEASTAGGVTEPAFFRSLMGLMAHKYKDVYAATAEVLGMLLAAMEEAKDFSLSDLRDRLVGQLVSLADGRNEDKFLVCLQNIARGYPQLTERFVSKLLFLLPSLQGVFRPVCLEVLCSVADTRTDLYLQLRDLGFLAMLAHRDEATQVAALGLVQPMLRHLRSSDMTELLPLISAFGCHANQDCRVLMYDILIWMYSNISPSDSDVPDDEASQVVLSGVRQQLLCGLADEAEGIRLKMYGFWNEESRLPSQTLGRLAQLLATLYSVATETSFLQHATNLLLELTSRSPDFSRSLFDTPLSDCKFEECDEIDLSWTQRHLQMTPLFAATLASQSLSATTGLGGGGEGGGREGGLRATQQSLAFTPTQEPGAGYNWMTPSMQSQDASVVMATASSEPQSSALLFARPSRPLRPVGADFGKGYLRPDAAAHSAPQGAPQGEVMKLKRRFIRDKRVTSTFYAKSGARRKALREEQLSRQRAARDSRVVMYRKYRRGDLPDIEIKHSELIRPLQALAQRDSYLARCLFSSLFAAVFSLADLQLTEEEATATKTAVGEGLNFVLETSELFHPPFVASLEDICFLVPQLALAPPTISMASLTAMQEPMGIVLLEKQLLSNTDSESAHSTKRARLTTAVATETTNTWVELARMYKSLGEFDVLQGIFGSHIGAKPDTRSALACEERGEYMEALQLYKEAMRRESWPEGPPSQAEEDLWEDSLLACYDHLTEWAELSRAAMVNVDEASPPRLDRLWEDSYFQEHYLPHVMRAQLKLALHDAEEPGFAGFLDSAIADSAKRRLLEGRYSTELALYSIHRGQLDRARYYMGNCLQAFLQDWSNVGALHAQSRSSQLRGLQLVTEMQEYLSLMSDSDALTTAAVLDLVQRWHSRRPHPRLDTIADWDNIVTSRCMMMRKLLEYCHTHPSLSNDSLSLKEAFSREFVQLYLVIAEAARGQRSYVVARKYLKLMEKAVAEFFSPDDVLQIEWIHGVAALRIQECQLNSDPSRVPPLLAALDKLGGRGQGGVSWLASRHDLARKQHLLEGRAFTLLAEEFRERGEHLVDTLSDDSIRLLNAAIRVAPPVSRLPPSETSHKLLLRGLASLKAGLQAGSEEAKGGGGTDGMVQGLVDMATFCDNALRAKEEDESPTGLDTSTFPTIVVTYVLKAMKYGSGTADQKLPRLLQIVQLHPDVTSNFVQKAAEVPSWRFIGWIGQMVALLDKPEAPSVHGILQSIADDYPQALCYPLKISSSSFKFDSSEASLKAVVEKLRSKVETCLVSDFVAALEQLVSPELLWKDVMDNDLKPLMEASVSERCGDRIKRLWSDLFDQFNAWQGGSASSLFGSAPLSVGPRQKKFVQDYKKKIEEVFGSDGSRLVQMKPSQFNSHYSKLYDPMKERLGRTTGPALLKDYSPWLHDFQAGDRASRLEVPGQYHGRAKPLPEYHAHISSCDKKVLVLDSMRKPKRLTLCGDDEREYSFLVKGGEDLRLDQRIEQLFKLMNELLAEDAACSQRGLRMRTYQVVPMTPRVGLIEWVEHTKPLKNLLMEAMTDSENKCYRTAHSLQKQWLRKYNESYKNMYRKASRSEVEKEYWKKVALIPWDLLRRAYMQLASSPEAFLALRSNFTRSTAVASVCQYVLGIGDRHLSNFMVDLHSGGIVAIDFGHAFGTATQFLPYPELVPIRLTPQMVQLLRPHSEAGQLRGCMVHALRALRDCHAPLLSTMDVFVKEPLLDWKAHARKQAKALKKEEEIC